MHPTSVLWVFAVYTSLLHFVLFKALLETCTITERAAWGADIVLRIQLWKR